MQSDVIVDAKGLSCPMPILKTKKAIDNAESDQVIEVHATDKGAINDLKAWANSTGHELLDHKEEGGVLKFWIRKK
ncbi:sulfurtransferase TusA family protein [Microaerobacter geothermalis]|uniref:sulfurtransferase TusA family protein n=1 Tax=Microaerobacter geothermalis TaxID=674972 RepID=UPI001F1D53CF|nr:sulfurtransferase TusA family protein [Microaerobacter geothermalis]MCF6093588.1 sulfurtransferase TusA family protein [Microaerobacter geothermalis]